MARPPLDLGTHGKITVVPRGGRHVAGCRYRDYDGVTRQIERTGPSKTAANRNLQDALRELRGPTEEPLRPESRLERAAALWLVKLDAQVADGTRRATTADTYRQRLNSVVLPQLGQLRLRECTVAVLDGFFARLAQRGMAADSRRTVRTVLSYVLAQAVKHEVLPANPVRELDRIEGRPKAPRALTTEERRRFLHWIDGGCTDKPCTCPDADVCRQQRAAQRRDLPDLVRFMLGTGVRLGECLAVRWCDVDLDGVPVDGPDGMRLVPVVAITGNIVRIKGGGLRRHDGKTEKSLRIVPLPRFVASLLQARAHTGAEDPVFAAGRRSGEPGWKDPHNTSRWIREARTGAGMTWPVTSHTFRKTAATIWNDAGILSDRQKADLTGHAKISTLKDVYVARGELHPQGAAVMDAAWSDT